MNCKKKNNKKVHAEAHNNMDYKALKELAGID
jgi:hypothetical protein